MRVHTGGNGRLAILLIVLLAGCAITQKRKAIQRERVAMWELRDAAIARKDFAVALQFDDAFSQHEYTPKLAAERVEHFAALVDAELAKIGPLTEDNAEVMIAILGSLRREAERTEDFPSWVAEGRRKDLAEVVANQIVPRMAEAATIVWAKIDAISVRGEHPLALGLAQALISELPEDDASVARLAQLKERAAQAHVALARAAPETAPGARVLHARIAKMFGIDLGPLVLPGEALLAETRQDWTISSPGSCGDVATAIDSPSQSLAQVLQPYFPSGNGPPAVLSVTFDSCPIDLRESETFEEQAFESTEIIQERVPVMGDSTCGNWSTTSDKGASSTTVTSTRHCGSAPTGEFTYVDREVPVVRTARTTTKHRVHTMKVTGTLRVEVYGTTREEPFSYEAESDDDVSMSSDCSQIKDCPDGLKTWLDPGHGWSEGQARLRIHDQLMRQIQGIVGPIVFEQGSAYLTAAREAIAAGDAMAAEHAFFIARELRQPTEDLFTWMATTYRLPAPLLAAALNEEPMPTLEVARVEGLTLTTILPRDFAREIRDLEEDRRTRGLLWISFTGGPMFASTTGGTGSQKGGIASFQAGAVFGRPLVLFGFTGGYGAGHGLIELDLKGGVGFRAGGLALHAVSGLGMNTSTGNQERIGPTPNDFIVPVAAYWLYGARLSYTFEFDGKLEAMYSKTFRTSAELASEKRLDLRMILFNAGLTMRYSEYLPDVDSFLGTFDESTRSAKTLWVLGGFGF